MAGYIQSTEREKSTTKITVPSKDLTKIDGGIKNFSDKRKLRELSIIKPVLQQMLVNRTYTVKKYKRIKKTYKISPPKLRKWKSEHIYHQEATVKTRHGTTDWFQIGKGVRQGCILSPGLFNFYVMSTS